VATKGSKRESVANLNKNKKRNVAEKPVGKEKR